MSTTPDRKLLYSILLVLLILAAILSVVAYHSQSRNLKVVFLDVGQGDAILIEQGDSQVLIDGGPDGQKLMEKLGEYVPFWDRKIELVISTHPDEDHIGGLIDVIKNYSIGQVVDNGVEHESQVYKKYEELIEKKRITYIEGRRGMRIKLENLAELDILYPDGSQNKENPKDTNASSLVSSLVYGKDSFLFTGDLASEGEQDLMRYGALDGPLFAGILKVSHHGSKYATSEDFLEAIKPEIAVISVGKNNRYGHPSPEIIDRLKARGIRILRTDEMGDVSFECFSDDRGCLLED